ncbi:MAG: hypothetical protein RBU29_01965 [bacterium]|jgi:hypothetical protein|nr:hypothetical protein [bacterium]
MMRKLGWCLGFILLLILNQGAVSEEKAESLFEDSRFTQGFLLQYTEVAQGHAVEQVLDWGNEDRRPVWRLCQWGSRFSLAGTEPQAGDDGWTWYANEGKQVGKGSGVAGDLILGVSAIAEYDGRARQAGEAWPHFLVEQDAVKTLPLDQVESIRLRGEFRLTHFQDGMGASADPGLHAAQFQLFFIVKNIESASADQGDFLWFGVPFFDNRHAVPLPYQALDAGKSDATGKFIHTIDGRDVNSKPMIEGGWIVVDHELLPSIRESVTAAVAKGYLRDGDLSHYAVVNMNMGWEVPGQYDVCMQVRGFAVMSR